MKFIDPRIDFAFKKIFGSEDTKDILISFLESLMGLEGDKRIQEVTLMDPFLAPRVRNMKESVLDVRCKDHRDVSYIVEMQVRKTRAFLKRIQFNAAKTYVNQIASGADYPRLNQVIAITITDFTLFDTFEHCVSHHQTREMMTGRVLLQEVAYWFIELSKFNNSLETLNNVLDKWIFFIKMASALEDVPERLREEPFCHAFEKARMANMDEKELEYYDKAGIAIADARGAVELARDEGIEKGRQKGRQEGRQEGRQKGRQEGRQEGEQIGEAKILTRQLQRRFGDLPTWASDRIAKADLPSLEAWSLRILDAPTLESVLADPS